MILKKIILPIKILVTVFLIFSCGSNNEKANQLESITTKENNSVQTKSIQTQETENISSTLKPIAQQL